MRTLLLAIFLAVPWVVESQGTTQDSRSASVTPFEETVATFELKDETIGDALGRLNQSYDISISVEGVLPDEGTITNPKLRGKIEGRTLADVFTWLCSLDKRYVWVRDGLTANFLPRASIEDNNYFFNRTLPMVHFREARKADLAAIDVVHQLGDPNENLICLNIGGNLNFSRPWTASFDNMSVRQALNRIARQLGPTYGWQIGGTKKQRLIVFHYKLGARPNSNVIPEN